MAARTQRAKSATIVDTDSGFPLSNHRLNLRVSVNTQTSKERERLKKVVVAALQSEGYEPSWVALF